MARIIGRNLEDILADIADSESVMDGGTASALTGMIGTALSRKVLDAIIISKPDNLSATDEKQIRWELEDAMLHFGKLLELEYEAGENVMAYELGTKDEGTSGKEIYQAAVSVAAAISTSSARVIKVMGRLSEAEPNAMANDVGTIMQMLYAAFIGGKMKMNHYFTHSTELDASFIADTRGKIHELEDEVSQIVGPTLERVWNVIHPEKIAD
ncbi:cyclodeaminase/cyclohydrolase family protein [bacterium]|nr:cyclodeaminase/cyclohydrolase family protein [bacterium]